MKREIKRRIDQYLQQKEKQMLDGIKRSVQIQSVKGEPSKEAPFGEGPRLALLDALKQADELGFKTENLDSRIGFAEYGDGEEMIAVLGHLDVVPAIGEWTHDPFCAEIYDGMLYGRGVLDDKGPVIGALYALAAVRHSGVDLKRRIRVIMGTDEESGSSCVAYYKERKQELPVAGFTPDACFPVIFCEKGCLVFEIGCELSKETLGRLQKFRGGTAPNVVMEEFEIHMLTEGGSCSLYKKGKSAHAAAPSLGINAGVAAAKELAQVRLAPEIDDMMRFIADYIGDETQGKGLGIDYTDEETGCVSVNLGILGIREGRAYLTLDIRYPNNADPEWIKKEVERKASSRNLEIQSIRHSPLMYLSKESALIKTLMNVYEPEMGAGAKPVAIGGGTYAKSFSNMAAFGPLFPGQKDCIHQPDEQVEVELLKKAVRMMAYAMAELAQAEEVNEWM